jgi:hypothetical protein
MERSCGGVRGGKERMTNMSPGDLNIGSQRFGGSVGLSYDLVGASTKPGPGNGEDGGRGIWRGGAGGSEMRRRVVRERMTNIDS